MNNKPAYRRQGWSRELVITCVITCIVGAVVLARAFVPRWREQVGVVKEMNWIRDAIQTLEKVGPPPASGAVASPWANWVIPGHFVFSNGWAAYKFRTMHAGNGIGDVAVMRTSDGRFFITKYHFCCGITDGMLPHVEHIPRPRDADDFLANAGQSQEWNLLSPDGRLRCVVRCPNAESFRYPKKRLYLRLSRAEGAREVIFCEAQREIAGAYIAWRTHWLPNKTVEVDVFDFGPGFNPMTHNETTTKFRSNHLATLTFKRDERTGQFSLQNQ